MNQKNIKIIFVLSLVIVTLLLIVTNLRVWGTAEYGADFTKGSYWCSSTTCKLGGTSANHFHKVVTDPDSSTWELGSILAINYSGTKTGFKKPNGNMANFYNSTFTRGFQVMQNLNFYCIEHGTHLIPGANRIIAEIVIDEEHNASGKKMDTIASDPTKPTTINQISNEENVKKANLILQEIIKQANNDQKETTRLNSSEVRYERRPYDKLHGTVELECDKYQQALWQHISTWQKTVFNDNRLASLISVTITDKEKESTAYKEAINTIVPKATQAAGDRLEREGIENLISSSKAKTTISGIDMLIGPFTINYSGTIANNFSVKYNNTEYRNNIYIYEGTTLKSIGYSELKNGNEFYVKIPISAISSSKINISTDIVDTEMKTIIYVIEAIETTNLAVSQSLIYTDQEETEIKENINCEFEIKDFGKLTIHKKDEKNANMSGVDFVLSRNDKYIKINSNNPVVTTNNGIDITKYTVTYVNSVNEATKFRTNASGKIVIKNLELYSVKSTKYTYCAHEVSNTTYGYRNAFIVDVQVTGGEELENREHEVDFTITKETTVTIKNKLELGNLIIHKVGKNNKNLADVEFAVYRNSKYLKINSLTSPVVTSNDGIDLTQYTVTYVEKISEATKFKTNESGKIVIKNLEIYSAQSTKYSYWLYEVSNNNYGYKNLNISEVEVTGGEQLEGTADKRWIHFNMGDNTTVKVSNPEGLGKLIIEKIGENNSKLQNVEFVIYRNSKYLKINSLTSPVVTSNDGIDLTQYTVTYVEKISEATKFKTNELGKIVIKNLEIYSAQSTKYSYWLYEVSNNNYGYKNLNITDVEVTGGEELEGTADKRWIHFNMGDNTTVKISNPEELGKLIIEKKDKNNSKLQNVEFVIYRDGQYLKIDSVTSPVVTEEDGIDLTQYDITYVEKISDATKFKTNEEGKIVINGMEIYSGYLNKYSYWVYEVSNENYGYKNVNITDVKVTGGEQLKVSDDKRWVNFKIGSETLIKIENTQELGNLQVTKVDKDNENIKLQNIEFKISIDESKYLQLIKAGKLVESVTETVTINKNNISNEEEYEVKYVGDSSKATKFITDEEGKLIVENLEIYSGKGTKFKYKLHEISNINYGYAVNASSIKNTEIQLVTEETTDKQVTNEKFLGGLEIVKVDEFNNGSIKLKDIEFVLSIDKDENTYIALYKDGKLVKEVVGIATINSNNVENSNEYRVKYKKLNKAYLDYTKEEREDLEVTTFKTDDNGQILISNLEVKNNTSNVNYKYRLTEIYNPYYGYEEIDGSKYYETELTKGKTASMGYDMTNIQEKIKISGYVWIENSEGKSNEYDYLYTESKNDIKLTDLYIVENGKLVKNKNASIPVEIKLRDKTTGKIIKEQPDLFDSNGKYTFADVELGNDDEKKLINYEVVFIYDGFYYTTTNLKLDKDNGSKAKEVETERTELNNKFATIKDNGEVITANGETNKVIYSETEQHKSTVTGFETEGFTTISANTTEAGINLKEKFDELKKELNAPIEGIDNINIGLVLREQPKMAVTSDIYSVEVKVKDYDYTYYYDERREHYENLNDDKVGVQFEQETSIKRYTKTVYSSDVKALQENRATMNVEITYKIQITNQARTLTAIVNEIANYFDADYTIEAIGLGIDGNNNITNELNKDSMPIIEGINVTYGEGITANEDKSYNSVRITLGENGLTLKAKETKAVYIRFSVSQDAIIGLINENSTYHNATEIMSYSSYYGAYTGQITNVNNEPEYCITETNTQQSKEGKIYAGIDRTSQPGNIKLELIEDLREAGTPILNNTYFEDDTNSAPSLLLEVVEARTVSGTIWEDKDAGEREKEKIGNGKFDEGEKGISGVTVSLYEVDDAGNISSDIATYSDGNPAVTVSDKNGNYKFGKYEENEAGTITTCYGVLPGRYIVKYTYKNGETFIVNNPEDLNQNKVINVNDYKSTVITSNTVKSAFEEYDNRNLEYPKRWYLEEETDRYSDARDYVELRKDMTSGDIVVNNKTYKELWVDNDTMIAHTPFMDIGIEFTKTDSTIVRNDINFETEFRKLDFGIIERPNIDIKLEKEITGLEIVAQNGTNIIPKGDPTNTETIMQYVKRLVRPTDGSKIVSAEIETKLLQGAKLNVEYTIKATNQSDKDYVDIEYYYYGTGGTTERNVEISKIVDYMDGSIKLDEEQILENWEITTIEQLKLDGYISQETAEILEEVKQEKGADFTVLITKDEYTEGDELKVYATKYMAVSDVIMETNAVEILELTGGRTITEAIPGNYKIPDDPPTGGPPIVTEPDSDRVDLIITPPTGSTVNYTWYAISAVLTSTILVAGILIIKKKIIK